MTPADLIAQADSLIVAAGAGYTAGAALIQL